MCYYLTLSFKKDFEDLVKSGFTEKILLRENKNAFFNEMFGRDFVSLDITDGHCSCSIYQILMADNSENETQQLQKKYRKKGWSESKIERAIADNQQTKNKDLINLREILANIAKQTGSLWLFAHQYSGLIANEHLENINHQELKIAELLDNKIEVPEDVIVKIK